MASLSQPLLEKFRAQAFHSTPELRLHSRDDAVNFVNERGFTFFWPIKGILAPSLWVATAGDRPVPNEHNDAGHVCWDWKDSLLGKKRWYYARILRRRNTIISLQTVPFFYALSPNYGDYETDHLIDYEQGALSLEAKNVYEALLQEGPLDTLDLRRAAHLTSSSSDARFNKALDDLQIKMRVLPIGVSRAGAWNYAFIYDLAPRHFPEVVEQARSIAEPAARKELVKKYLLSVGGAALSDITRLFQWQSDKLKRTLQTLTDEGFIQKTLSGEKPVEWLALPQLIESE